MQHVLSEAIPEFLGHIVCLKILMTTSSGVIKHTHKEKTSCFGSNNLKWWTSLKMEWKLKFWFWYKQFVFLMLYVYQFWTQLPQNYKFNLHQNQSIIIHFHKLIGSFWIVRSIYLTIATKYNIKRHQSVGHMKK